MTATIERLGSEDVSFLRYETQAAPWHIGALAIVDGSTLLDAGGRLDLENIRTRLSARITKVPELRRRLYHPPLLGGRPVWVDDDTFDMTYHLRQASVPAPGGEAQLLGTTAGLLESLLDRNHPLWELWFLTGLDANRVGLLLKLHHALADGLSAVAIVGNTLFDAMPGAPDPEPANWKPAPIPGYRQLVGENLKARSAAVARAVRGIRHTRQIAGEILGMVHDTDRAPAISLNRPVRRGRHVRFSRLDLEAVKHRAHAAGGKVNDVVLALVAAGLREVMVSRGESVEGVELIASVPVALHDASQPARIGNDTGGIRVHLPIGVADPADVLEFVVEASRRAKATQQPAFMTQFMSVLATLSIGRVLATHQTWINLPVTNVPGPPFQLYLMGAPILDVLPIVPLAGNCTLLVCAFSYSGRICLVANADATACPDVDVFMAGMERAWLALRQVAPPTSASDVDTRLKTRGVMR